MSPDLSELIAGVLKGTLEWGADLVKSTAAALRNRELAFFGTEETVGEAKAVSSDPSFRQYKRYIQDRDLRILVRAGVLLRRWQQSPLKKKAIGELRNKIHSKYGDLGLHIAEVIQSGILDEVVKETSQDEKAAEFTARALETFLRASDQLCLFVKGVDSASEIGGRLVRTLRRDKPVLSVLFSLGNAARRVTAGIVSTLMVNTPEYRIASKEISGSTIVILVRLDVAPIPR